MLWTSIFLSILFSFNTWATWTPQVEFGILGEGLSREDFRQVIKVFETEFQKDAQERGRVFEIFADWSTDWAQAFARRWETDHLIVYGGIARIPGSTVDTLALILCHEVGHLYGGEPYSDDFNQISLEGQADWWATAACWERIVAKLPRIGGDARMRASSAAVQLTSYFAAQRGQATTDPTRPDLRVVERMLMTHPEPQCRLDTFLAGLSKSERPRCWWAP